MRLVDTHSHIHFEPLVSKREEVLKRMTEADIGTITVGTSAKTSESAIAYAESTDRVWASVGYHPEHLTSSFQDPNEGSIDEFDADHIRRVAKSSPRVVAIGETGLDFFRIDPERDRNEAEQMQENAFRFHIELAEELDLPVIIHCRDAMDRLKEILREERGSGRRIRGVVHCFTGSWAEAEPLLDLGLYISFTGIITFPVKKGADPERDVHHVIERMPIDRLLIETDAPWLAPVPYRGKENEPAFVRYVAERVAQIRKMSFDAVAEQTTRNAIQLFNL